jgi:hypothetical protein
MNEVPVKTDEMCETAITLIAWMVGATKTFPGRAFHQKKELL